MAAELAQSAVPMDAAANVGRDVKLNAVGPAERKPKAVVDTTRAERRAFDSSARWDICGLLVLACESVIVVLLLVARSSDAALLLLVWELSSGEVVEKEV